MTPEELAERRKKFYKEKILKSIIHNISNVTNEIDIKIIYIFHVKFFKDMNEDYPPVVTFVATSSGIVEPVPTTQDEWDNFHENLQFVDGIERGK